MMPANRLAIISIHALLAESDGAKPVGSLGYFYFYPRSPCGERRVRGVGFGGKLNFYPRSPCGERLFLVAPGYKSFRFLSTLSLRRATALGLLGWLRVLISIHALLAESDIIQWEGMKSLSISIHALLAESDCWSSQPATMHT